MLTSEDLKTDEDAIYLPPFFMPRQVRQKTESPVRCAPSERYSHRCRYTKIERRTGVRYDEIQAQAIRTALASKVMILTGALNGKEYDHQRDHCGAYGFRTEGDPCGSCRPGGQAVPQK